MQKSTSIQVLFNVINMMGAAASQPAPGAPSSFRSKRCARPCLPDIEPSAPVPMNDHPVPVDKEAMRSLIQVQKNVVLLDIKY